MKSDDLANKTLTAPVGLTRMEYYDNTSSAVAKPSWSSSAQAKQVIPQDRLYPAP